MTWDLFAWPKPRLVSEFVVDLPARNDPTEDKNPRASDSSDIHWLAQHQFLVLSRDSGHGRGADNTTSQWRHIDIVDTKRATNMAEQTVGATAVAPNGYLLPGINTAEYCEFIDINNSTELARFGLHNGGDGDFATELNEKWESIAIIPVPWGAPGHGAHEYYVVSVSDNDFITQDGYYDFGKTKYADESGTSVDTQVLVWQVNLPQYSWY